MTDLTDRYVALVSCPKGVPEARRFEVREALVPELKAGQILVRNAYWSVDPAMRGWVNDAPNYPPPVEIGAAMRSFAVGEFARSRNPDYAEGETVAGMFGWRRYSVLSADQVDRKVETAGLPAYLALGMLGLNGVTAYFGLLEACAVKEGDTVVVSTAAGAVGSAVGQIAS